ncbi:MAG: T9SS type A sorting domain-containing protein [Candidatus Cloacimonetes bacterium]|nr:T9SS type A sorting domain-containing protein [Candidatus Cloacimonadota bacterium]
MKRAIIFTIVMLLGLASVWADDWNPLTDPRAPSPRQGHGTVTLGINPLFFVYLFGGEDAEGILLNDTYEFDEDGWDEVIANNSPPPARRDHQAWARADLMYIYGGYGENGALDDLWSYNSTTNTWQEEQISGPGPVARHGHATTTLTDGSEIIVCGTDVNGDPLDDCWKLNPDNTFTQLQDAPHAYTGHSLELSPDGEWLYVFGKPGSLGIYRTSTDRWSLVSGGPPNGPGCCTSRGVNAAGEPVVFIFGGKDINGNEMSDVYEYNLYGGELTQRGDMPQPIVNGADAQLPVVPPGKQQFGNNWLVFGGLSGGIPTNNSYAFTPISAPDTITVVSPMDSVFADSVMMIWNPAEPWQATHYQLLVASDSAMTIFFADTIVTDTSYLVKELINNTDYWWQVRGYNAGGWGPYNNPVHFLVNFVVSIDDNPHQNSTLALTTSPNPFNDHISISFSLQEPQQVTCSLYNMKGEKIQTLFSGQSPVGFNEHEKNIVNLRSGVYLIKLQSQNSEEIQKIIHF